MRLRKCCAPQRLPSVDPKLPEIRVDEQPGPPGRIEESTGVPSAGVRVSTIDRSQGAVKIPMRSETDLAAAGFEKKGAVTKDIHVPTEDLQDMEIDPGINIDV